MFYSIDSRRKEGELEVSTKHVPQATVEDCGHKGHNGKQEVMLPRKTRKDC